jgi:hypothetical protein
MDFSRTAQGILVHQTVVDHLVEAHISGWRPGCVRVETVPKFRDHDTVYYELIVIGHTRGYTEHVALKLESECRECSRKVFVYPREGLIIPEECWDMSDIFVIDELPGIHVVTEAFRNIIEKYQHTGVEFVAIDEWRDRL